MTKKQFIQVENYAKKTMSRTLDERHDYKHVNTVRNNALKIVNILNINHIDTYTLQSACLLHDLTYTKYKSSLYAFLFEGLLVRPELKKAFTHLEIDMQDKTLIWKSVIHHPNILYFVRLFKTKDLYTSILQDADAIESFRKSRIESYDKKYKNKFISMLIQKITTRLYLYGKKNLIFVLNYPKLSDEFFI